MLAALANVGGRALGGTRFTLINVFPGGLVLLTVLATYRSGAYGSGKVDVSDVIPSSISIGQVAIVVIAALLLGVLAQPFQVGLVRALEGYGWAGKVPTLLLEIAIERHIRRLRLADRRAQDAMADPPANLSIAEAVRYDKAARRADRLRQRASDIIDSYPDEERVMPTLLGNVLRRTEDTAGGRYELPTMAAYPRMYPYISPKLEAAIRQQLDLIDTTSALCVSMVLSATATLPVAIRLDSWSLLPIAFLLLAILSYQGAIRAAAWHGVLLCTAFDLHRFDLTAAMHFHLPVGPRQELSFNRKLRRFLLGEQSLTEAFARTTYNHPRRPSASSESNGATNA